MNKQFTILHPERMPKGKIKAAIFDFDGTCSTLRCGWEKVMEPLMLEEISGGPAENASKELVDEVKKYIDSSTGIQTVYQMQWLKERVGKEGRGRLGRDECWYKTRYNERLMENVGKRLTSLENGTMNPEDFLVKGCVKFILSLRDHGIDLYLASGTDHKDVVHEANALNVARYFTEIKGAPEHVATCSKESVIRMILEEKGLKGEELLLVGDGKVEIALGVQNGAYTLGAATDEEHLCGVNEVKLKRLINAGADAVTGDFTELDDILDWLNLK